MKVATVSLGVLAVSLAMSAAAQAQPAEKPEMLPETVAEGQGVADAYAAGTGLESGTSTVSREEIEARSPGSGDVNQILKIMPTVQFSRDEGIASPDNILDLRPADISISGGRIYNNLITLDGIDVGSRLDVTNDNPFNGEPVALSAQTLWVDANLVGEVTLRDSNVSAEYGSFTGGVLSIKTRDPKRFFGVNAYVHRTDSSLTEFNLSKGTRAAFEEAGDPVPDEPEFHKWRFGGAVDAPLSDKASIMIAASRQVAEVTNYRTARYGNQAFEENSRTDNFLLSGVVDLGDDLLLRGKATYSPYRIFESNPNTFNSDVENRGGGGSAMFELVKSGTINWDLTGSYHHSDSSVRSEQIGYSIASDSAYGNVCSLSSCSFGGLGNLDQTQDTYALAFKASMDLGRGKLRGGLQYDRVEASRKEGEESFSYNRSIVPSDLPEDIGDAEYGDGYEVTGTILCDVADPLTCSEGEYATAQYNYGPAYDINVALDSFAAWAEYDVTFGAFDLRAGLRYDYESFLGNHNVGPRLAVTWNAPGNDWQVTAGANRYYAKSMLAYAIRQGKPNTFLYRRRGTVVGNDVLFTDDDWFLYRETQPATYNNADIKTPYSDELTAAVTGRLLGGTVRLKGIYRWGKDELALSASELMTSDTATGGNLYRSYEVTNGGRTTYKGLSLEWVRNFARNHSFALNANYSETKTTNVNYFESTDAIEYEDGFVLLDGEVVSEVEVKERNRRLDYAAPLIINATWTASWLDRLTTNVNLRYRNGFDQIEDSLINETVDGVRYDVYHVVRYRDSFDLNFNANIEVIRSAYGTLALDVRASNILNRIPSKEHVSTSEPWQYGRQFWLGATFDF